MKNMKKIPTFNSEKDEREFWELHDSMEFIDWKEAKKALFPNLKKSTKTISLRLPADMLDKIKIKANTLDIPYQSLIKMVIQRGLQNM